MRSRPVEDIELDERVAKGEVAPVTVDVPLIARAEINTELVIYLYGDTDQDGEFEHDVQPYEYGEPGKNIYLYRSEENGEDPLTQPTGSAADSPLYASEESQYSGRNTTVSGSTDKENSAQFAITQSGWYALRFEVDNLLTVKLDGGVLPITGGATDWFYIDETPVSSRSIEAAYRTGAAKTVEIRSGRYNPTTLTGLNVFLPDADPGTPIRYDYVYQRELSDGTLKDLTSGSSKHWAFASTPDFQHSLAAGKYRIDVTPRESAHVIAPYRYSTPYPNQAIRVDGSLHKGRISINTDDAQSRYYWGVFRDWNTYRWQGHVQTVISSNLGAGTTGDARVEARTIDRYTGTGANEISDWKFLIQHDSGTNNAYYSIVYSHDFLDAETLVIDSRGFTDIQIRITAYQSAMDRGYYINSYLTQQENPNRDVSFGHESVTITYPLTETEINDKYLVVFKRTGSLEMSAFYDTNYGGNRGKKDSDEIYINEEMDYWLQQEDPANQTWNTVKEGTLNGGTTLITGVPSTPLDGGTTGTFYRVVVDTKNLLKYGTHNITDESWTNIGGTLWAKRGVNIDGEVDIGAGRGRVRLDIPINFDFSIRVKMGDTAVGNTSIANMWTGLSSHNDYFQLDVGTVESKYPPIQNITNVNTDDGSFDIVVHEYYAGRNIQMEFIRPRHWYFATGGGMRRRAFRMKI